MDIKKSDVFATSSYQGLQLVARYMKDRAKLIESVLPKEDTLHRDKCLIGLWLRARAWMESLELLNRAKHFQAISTANRAFLEIVVDMILLHHDKTNKAGLKMYQHGISERMKSAEQIVNFFTEKGELIPDEFKSYDAFCKNDKAKIDDIRRSFWPNKKNPKKAEHPRRWTGRSGLPDDVKEADRLYGAEVKSDLGVGLLEYYRTEYRRMNWQIHSGVAGFWNFHYETFDSICGLSFKWCADFGMLCTKIILKDFGYDIALEGLRQEWDNIKMRRGIIYAKL